MSDETPNRPSHDFVPSADELLRRNRAYDWPVRHL